MDDATLDRYAGLIVAVGANVQPGQVVHVFAVSGTEPLARAVADEAYRRGARFVDVDYFDPHVKRSRLLHAPDETLDYVPPWYGETVRMLGREGAASVTVWSPLPPALFDGIDAARAGRDRLPQLKESMELINERNVNWTVCAWPTAEWARRVHPGLAEEEALAELERQVAVACRLDEPDPAAAWRAGAPSSSPSPRA